MELIILLYSIGSSISILSTCFIIYGYFSVKLMKRHPEVLVAWQCISQIVFDAHWYTGISSIHDSISEYCQVAGAVFLYFYYLSWNYILYLSIEILVKIKDPLNCNYSKRLQMYHMVAHLISLSVFGWLVAVQDNDGRTFFNTCLVQSGTIYELLVFFPVIFHVPICLGIGIYTLWYVRIQKKGFQLRHHNLVVLIFIICWGAGAMDHGLHMQNVYEDNLVFDAIVAGLGVPAGFLVFLARMSQKGLFMKILRTLFRRKKTETVNQSDKISITAPINDISQASVLSQNFEKLTFYVLYIQATCEVLEGLTKYFKYCLNSERDRRTETSLKFNISSGKIIKIEQFFANNFKKIMKVSGISYYDLMEYLIFRSFSLKNNVDQLELRCKSISGKSGAFFYFTKNKQFIIKSIKVGELKVLTTMINEYCNRIKNSNTSMLAKIFGVFKISVNESSPKLLVIIENLTRNFEKPLVFDLKGSTYMRRSSNIVFESFDYMPKSQVYKDIDFLNCYKRDFNYKEGRTIFKNLEIDTNLLENYAVMDYSLLLVVEEIKNTRDSMIKSENCFRIGEFICTMGIIDFLQNYTYRKKLETKINKLKNVESDSFSCIPPDAYRNRFLKLMFDIFVGSSSAPSSP